MEFVKQTHYSRDARVSIQELIYTEVTYRQWGKKMKTKVRNQCLFDTRAVGCDTCTCFSKGTLLNSHDFPAAFGPAPQMNATWSSLSCIPQSLAEKQLAPHKSQLKTRLVLLHADLSPVAVLSAHPLCSQYKQVQNNTHPTVLHLFLYQNGHF